MRLLRQLRWVALLSLLTPVVLMGTLRALTEDGTVTLGISPQILELSVNPGESQTSTFRLTNGSSQAIEVKTTAKNFTPRGEEGAIDLTEDNTTFSLASWMTTTPASTALGPATTKDFTVTINVPSDAEPGSHFGSIVFSTIPPKTGGGSGARVSEEIAPVILVKVAGDIKESAEIASFKPGQSLYSLENNVDLKSRIKNTGNVHFKPNGKIIIKNMFGNEVASLGLDKRNVLPDSIREITTNWKPGRFAVGIYHATLTMVTGDDNKITTAETTIVIFPFQVIIPVLALIIFLVYVIYKGRSRLSNAAKALRGKPTSEK